MHCKIDFNFNHFQQWILSRQHCMNYTDDEDDDELIDFFDGWTKTLNTVEQQYPHK